jgi:hypothetical protein
MDDEILKIMKELFHEERIPQEWNNDDKVPFAYKDTLCEQIDLLTF